MTPHSAPYPIASNHGVGRLLVLLAIFGLILGSASPAFAQNPAPPAQAEVEDLEAFLDGVMADQMRQNHIPGAVIVMVRDGEVFFSKGYGYADLETRQPVDPAMTLFRPGSASKLFTWTAVMQLVEQGRLLLDEDINTYLDFEVSGLDGEPITMRHLMSHTAGFEDVGDNLFKLNPDEVISLEDYVKQMLPQRVYAPGTVGAYSNYGTALAGYIVEHASGMSFNEYAETYIFEPLEMTQATFRQPLPDALAPHMSKAYNYVNAEYVEGGFEYVVPYPVGGLSASGLDMAKFMIAHLQNGAYGGARILQEETAAQMHSQVLAHDPRIAGMAHGFMEIEANGQRAISHGGDTLLFHTGLWLLPDQGTGLFISTNGTQGAAAVEAVWETLMDRYYPVEDVPALTPTGDFESRAPLYSGSYYSARNNFSTFEKVLRLTAPVSVQVDDDNTVVMSIMGQTARFVEVEPGLLVDVDDPDMRFVMKQMDGQVYLYPPMPFTFIKADAAASTGLHGLILVGGALLFLSVLIRWLVSILSRRRTAAGLMRIARVIAALFGIAFLVMMFTIISQFMSINPAYGVPDLFFGVSDSLEQVMTVMPLLVLGLAVGMVIFTILLWVRSRGVYPIFYTFLTLAALAIVWSLNYWNLLL